MVRLVQASKREERVNAYESTTASPEGGKEKKRLRIRPWGTEDAAEVGSVEWILVSEWERERGRCSVMGPFLCGEEKIVKSDCDCKGSSSSGGIRDGWDFGARKGGRETNSALRCGGVVQ